MAWSYPPDTFGLTAQAKVQGLNVKAYYTAVATAFPAFGGKFGKSAEGILGAGGINPDTKAMKDYFASHKAVTGKTPDYWASGMVYATFQILRTAIEAVGTKDRKAVTAYIKSNTWRCKNYESRKWGNVGRGFICSLLVFYKCSSKSFASHTCSGTNCLYF